MIRAGNCRSEINLRVGRIVRMFKWGGSEELISPLVHECSCTVPGASVRADPGVQKSRLWRPVSDETTMAVNPFVSRQVWAIIELQWLTGMRPGEVVIMPTPRSRQFWGRLGL